jgi:predicted exporter
MKSGYRTAGVTVSLLAMLSVVLILSTAACLFDEHGDHHGAPAHDLCAGLVALAVGSGLVLMLETLGRAHAVSRWAMVTTIGAILDPPPRGILR